MINIRKVMRFFLCWNAAKNSSVSGNPVDREVVILPVTYIENVLNRLKIGR